MCQYAIYLRKSRADAEAEARGEGETLARHEKALTDFARRMHYPVIKIYREIVSGESIANRPEMTALLSDVSARKYAGVLVMEVERLARGDTSDQAVVAATFKFSNTLIITPVKTYDPNNTVDEEYFEFSLFMSRREYKTIVRRMQTGRRLAAAEGRYISSRPPYGYEPTKLPTGECTLAIKPNEAEIVRQIFAWHIAGEGGGKIATRLTNMGIPSPYGAKAWWQTTVRNIIKNPVYIGHVTWDKRVDTVVGIDESGRKIHKRVRNASYTDAVGIHPAIVSDDTFRTANGIARPAPPVRHDLTISNPFIGMVRCSICGHTMQFNMGREKPDGTRYPDRIRCRNPACPTIGCTIAQLESAVSDTLHVWAVEAAEAPAEKPQTHETEIVEKQLSTLRVQQNKLCDFLERGIYDEQTFVLRSSALRDQIAAAEHQLSALRAAADKPTPAECIRKLLPMLESFDAAYAAAPDPSAKHALLAQVISHIVLSKTTFNALPDITVYPFGVS